MARLTIDTRVIVRRLKGLIKALLLPAAVIYAAYIIGPAEVETWNWNATLILAYIKALIWPLTVLLVIGLIRKELPRLIRRMKKLSVASASAEFGDLGDGASGEGELPTTPDGRNSWTLPVTEQFRVDNLIASLYYAGLSNISLQQQLAETRESTNINVLNLTDQSDADYHTLLSWIQAAKDWEDKVQKSPVANLYRMITGVSDQIRSTDDFYSIINQA